MKFEQAGTPILKQFKTVELHQTLELLRHHIPVLDPSFNTQKRLETFETLIIDSFSRVVLQSYLPHIGRYTTFLLTQFPNLQKDLVNTAGQFGIKALAGVATVMCKPFDTQTVQAAMPGLYTMFLHHLLEVVSDKLGGEQAARQLCVPDDLVDVFNVLALQLLDGESFSSLQSHFIDYLAHCSLLELKYNRLYEMLMSNIVFDTNVLEVARNSGAIEDMHTVSNFFEYPIRYFLLLNLLVVEVAKDFLEDVTVFVSQEQPLQKYGKAVLYDFATKALKQRYISAAFLNRNGYGSLTFHKALDMRADAILTDYTMSATLSSLAAGDTVLYQAIVEDRLNIQNTIRTATYLIGLANDCGSRLLEMNIAKLTEMLREIAMLAPEGVQPRTYFTAHEYRIPHSMPEYRLFFPLSKDARKGEENLAFDLRLLPSGDLWSHFIHNTVSLAAVFQSTLKEFERLLDGLKHKPIAQSIENFVNYNFQIYDAGADYDREIPIIEYLPIMVE